jgi:phage-related protein (TIGR01555 family)
MGRMQQFADGLMNVITGSGTSVDRKEARVWQERVGNAFTVETAYRSSWMMRKAVRIPANDAIRNGWNWQAPPDDITAIEREEKRLRVRAVLKQGLTYGRLGGGVVVMGINEGQSSQPLPDVIPQGGLRYLRAYSRHRIKLGPLIADPMDDEFGEPEYFILKAKDGVGDVILHRDRVLVFKGEFVGHLQSASETLTDQHPFWGESVVTGINDAVMNATDAQDEIAGLISEAKVDVFGIPELMSMMGDQAAERRVMRRLEIAQASKSIHRAVVRDAEETWEQRQLNLGGMRDIILCYAGLVCAAADIPATRFLGKSPDGMNATGDSDSDNYDQMIQDIQTDELGPNMDKLVPVLVQSALGPGRHNDDAAPYMEFAPLHKPSASEAAEVESKEADTVSKLVTTGLIPDEALAQSIANRMIESGRWPGLEAALEELGERWWEIALEEPEPDPLGANPNPGAPNPRTPSQNAPEGS